MIIDMQILQNNAITIDVGDKVGIFNYEIESANSVRITSRSGSGVVTALMDSGFEVTSGLERFYFSIRDCKMIGPKGANPKHYQKLVLPL